MSLERKDIRAKLDAQSLPGVSGVSSQEKTVALVSNVYGKEGKTETRKPRGRKDSEGQEMVIKHHVLVEREAELVNLGMAKNAAAEEFGEAIKACAEASGYNAAAVRKYIAARVGDDFDEAKKKVEQLSLIFAV